MRHTDHRGKLEVTIETKECELPENERSRLQGALNRVAEAAGDLPGRLEMKIIYHPRSSRYHARAALRLPRHSVFSSAWDMALESALDQCLRQLPDKIEQYKQEPNREGDHIAKQIDRMNNAIIAPEDPAMGPIGDAVMAGDYVRFRKLLNRYEDWVRLRIGRWIQRYPDLQAELGESLFLLDLVEEVFLNLFEHYTEWPAAVPFHDFVEEWIDASLRDVWRNPDGERENIWFVRSLSE